MSFKSEIDQAQAAIDAMNEVRINAAVEKQAAALVQAMQSTQKNIMQTFSEFQQSFQRMTNELLEANKK